MTNNNETMNTEPQALVYSMDAINSILWIIDRDLNVQGISQIRAVSNIVGILSNPYKQIGLQELIDKTDNKQEEQTKETEENNA